VDRSPPSLCGFSRARARALCALAGSEADGEGTAEGGAGGDAAALAIEGRAPAAALAHRAAARFAEAFVGLARDAKDPHGAVGVDLDDDVGFALDAELLGLARIVRAQQLAHPVDRGARAAGEVAGRDERGPRAFAGAARRAVGAAAAIAARDLCVRPADRALHGGAAADVAL